MSGKKTFLVGPGFIGWVVLDLLIKENYDVTALVRRKEHAEALEKHGAKVVYGQLHDHDVIAENTASSDIVFHTATADDMPSVKAILDGVQQRAKQGKNTIYIHTSGTSLLADGAAGNFKTDKIYSDKDRSEIDSLPDDAPHRSIDLEIVRVQKELGDQAKIAIVAPPLIYGYNEWNDRLSIQIPSLTKFAIKHGYAGHVNKGLSVWSTVHVNDLGRAYMTVLHELESSPSSYVLDNPYFFCENGKEFAWGEAAEEIGKGLHKAGKVKDPAPKTIPEELYGDVCGEVTPSVVGCNSRSRAVRLRQLGWKPQEKGVFESLHEDEIPAMLKQAQS